MEQITAYTEHGIIEAHGSRQAEWRFSHVSIIRLRRAKRLERDLGLNAAGIALALDLMAEIETLKSRLIRLERMNNDNNLGN
jgi:chaperone modulatory protein CbpM